MVFPRPTQFSKFTPIIYIITICEDRQWFVLMEQMERELKFTINFVIVESKFNLYSCHESCLTGILSNGPVL